MWVRGSCGSAPRRSIDLRKSREGEEEVEYDEEYDGGGEDGERGGGGRELGTGGAGGGRAGG